jgi:hypothetical protein
MLFGWLTTSVIIPQHNLPREVWNIIPNEITSTTTIFDLGNTIEMTDDILREFIRGVEREAERQSGIFIVLSRSEIRQFEDALEGFQTASVVVNIVTIIKIVAIFMLLLFVLLAFIESKYGDLVGLIGTAIALLIAIAFAISMFILNSTIQDVLRNIDALREFRNVLTIGSSIWVYLTIAFSAINLIFITVRKKIIKGGEEQNRQKVKSMYCSHCGKPKEENYIFCVHCGANNG